MLRKENMTELSKSNSLEEVFNNVDYFVEKMYGYGSYSGPLRKVGLEMIEDKLNNLLKIFDDMKIDLNDHNKIKEIYNQLEYPICELKKYFNGDTSHMNDKDAEIFVWFVGDRLCELDKLSKDICRCK